MAIHKLYGELAASLVRATSNCWRPGVAPARAGADLGGWGGLSAFEGGCSILRRLGVASVEDKLTIDADRVAEFVTERSRAGQITLPPIDDALEAWVSLANQLGHASLKRLPFVPHVEIRPVMKALVGSGYAKAFDDSFLWTDRIGRAMQMSGWWDEHGFSREEFEERDVDREMRAALASIPGDIRLAALRGDRVAVAKALATRWIDGAWLPDRIDEASWWGWAALGPEAKRLVELVQCTDGMSMFDIN